MQYSQTCDIEITYLNVNLSCVIPGYRKSRSKYVTENVKSLPWQACRNLADSVGEKRIGTFAF